MAIVNSTNGVFEEALSIQPEICHGAIDEDIVFGIKEGVPKMNNATCFSGNLARQVDGMRRPICKRVSLEKKKKINKNKLVVGQGSDLFKTLLWWGFLKTNHKNKLMTIRSLRQNRKTC
jgi:hypothetical protein